MAIVIAALVGATLGLIPGLWLAFRSTRCRSCRRALQVLCRPCTPITDPYAYAFSSRAPALASNQLRDRESR